jgi:hypothetical protein
VPYVSAAVRDAQPPARGIGLAERRSVGRHNVGVATQLDGGGAAPVVVVASEGAEVGMGDSFGRMNRCAIEIEPRVAVRRCSLHSKVV